MAKTDNTLQGETELANAVLHQCVTVYFLHCAKEMQGWSNF